MKILMYYDGTEYTDDALATVKKHAQAFRADIDVVTSVSRNREAQPEALTAMEGGLMALKTALNKENIPVATHLLTKGRDAGDDIISFAEENKVDEIIISAEKKTRVDKFILGAVARYVILNAACPVVII